LVLITYFYKSTSTHFKDLLTYNGTNSLFCADVPLINYLLIHSLATVGCVEPLQKINLVFNIVWPRVRLHAEMTLELPTLTYG